MSDEKRTILLETMMCGRPILVNQGTWEIC